ncbi:MAG TPA: tryptophan synthase subunit alpha [Candidatus Sulfotelmatobacter sp.]|nr:tryptophan synthase subunit alpha [Candidatus Sulfotelmatobacter sp.]
MVSERRISAAIRRHARPTALIPYLTAGYPSIAESLSALREVEAAGAAVVEIGIPFSDPIADGPDIQRASEWALRSGVGAPETIALVRELRKTSSIPVVIMTYMNPVLRHGPEKFARQAAEAGVDGVLISDLPPEEAPEMWSAFDAASLDTVVLVAPTTPPERAATLAARSRGFLYCLARTGVTGGSAGESTPIEERVRALRGITSLPIVVGFGIGNAEQARRYRGIADALAVGAAFMRRVAENPDHGAAQRVGELARELVGALV